MTSKIRKKTVSLFRLLKSFSVSAEELLAVIFLATGALIALSFIYSEHLISIYFNRARPIAPAYLFDLGVRNGVFKYLFFVLFIVLAYVIAKRIFKHAFDNRVKVLSMVLGLFVASTIYFSMPYLVEAPSGPLGQFAPYPTTYNTTTSANCGDAVDFFFYSHMRQGQRAYEEIQKLKSEGLNISVHCIGDGYMNGDKTCEYMNFLSPSEGEKRRSQLGLSTWPKTEIVIGCNKVFDGFLDANTTKRLICDETSVC